MEQKLFKLADKLRELREEKNDQTAILKDITSEIDAVEYELAQAMVDAECPNFTRGDRQFILTMRTYWSAADGQKDALYDALKKQGHESLFTVNSQTLGSFIREQAESYAAEHDGEEGLPDWLTGKVKSYDDAGVTVKKSKK